MPTPSGFSSATASKTTHGTPICCSDSASAMPQGFETQTSTPAELKAYIAKELQRWERVIKDNQIKVSL